MTTITEPAWKTPLSAALMVAVIVAFCLTSLGNSANWLLHDVLTRDVQLEALPEDRPLLVEIGPQSSDEETLAGLVKTLMNLNARHIIVLPPFSDDVINSKVPELSIAQLPKLTAAVELGRCSTGRDGSGAFQQRAAHLPEFRFGATRFLRPTGAADCEGIAPYPDKAGELALNFLFLNAGLPLVNADQVRDGALIEELVAGRTVLLGASTPYFGASFPVPAPEGQISYLMLQGLAWETLANDGVVFHTPLWQTLIATILLVVVNLLVLQPLTSEQAVAFSLVVILGIAAFAVFLLNAAYQVAPVAELTLAQLTSLLFVRRFRRKRADRAIEAMLTETGSLLAERLTPPEFHQTENPWGQIIVLINQQLNLHRSILLEKVPKDHRVREIQALNCSLEHIAEQRRDYQRTPYSSAIELAGPLQLNTPYFKEPAEGELEYLVPLMFGSEILGFWALTVVPDEGWNREAFEHNIANFSNQIGELIYHRDQWQQEQKRLGNTGLSLLKLQGGRLVHRELAGALFLLEKRLDELEDVFSGLSSAAVLFNVFGQVTLVNRAMEELANQSELTLYSMTAVELLGNLCELSPDEARRQLRHVTLKQLPISLKTRRVLSHKRFILNLRPIKPSEDEANREISFRLIEPFELVGILFELVDVSHTEQLLFLRDDLYGQFARQMKNQFNKITLAVNQLTKTKEDDTVRRELVLSVDQSISQSMRLLEKLGKKDWTDDVAGTVTDSGPVNPLRIIREAERACQKPLAQARISVKHQHPVSTNLVHADGEQLKLVISATIELLAQDGVPDSELIIDLQEQSLDNKLTTRITLSNEGYGLPQSTVDAIRLRDASMLVGSSDKVENCLGMLRFIEFLGGTFEVETQVGQGFKIQIILKGITLAEPN